MVWHFPYNYNCRFIFSFFIIYKIYLFKILIIILTCICLGLGNKVINDEEYVINLYKENCFIQSGYNQVFFDEY